MKFDDIKCTKAICEKYTFKFNNGWDYAVITIDNTGIFQCTSSFGNYSYHWGAFGKNFKEFLTEIDTSYLLNKIANEDYFDIEGYRNKAFKAILNIRRNEEIDKETARELWSFISDDLGSYTDSYDFICNEIYNNKILSKLYDGEIFNSEFSPEKTYHYNAITFVQHIFPAFVEVLKSELKEKH